jgi:RibD C-terminal domain
VSGVTLPLALADLGLIDEYEFVVHPILAGHGPTLFAGLNERLELRLVGRQEFRSGAVALRTSPVESSLERSAAPGHAGLETPPQRRGRHRCAVERRMRARCAHGRLM